MKNFRTIIAITTTPWKEKLFKVVESTEPLNNKKKAILHTHVTKIVFVQKG